MLRVGSFRGHLHGLVSVLFGVVERLIPVAETKAGQRFMDGDAGQPGGEGGASGELIEVFVSPDVGVLHDVFGFGVAMQDGARDPVETLVVTTHDDFIKRSLSPTNAADNFLVSQAFRSDFFRNYGWSHETLIPTRVQDKEKVTNRPRGLDGALQGG